MELFRQSYIDINFLKASEVGDQSVLHTIIERSRCMMIRLAKPIAENQQLAEQSWTTALLRCGSSDIILPQKAKTNPVFQQFISAEKCYIGAPTVSGAYLKNKIICVLQ